MITGEGRYFTSGLDFASLRTNVGEGTDGIVRGSNIRRQYRAEAHHDLFDELERVEKPVILAAQSHCFGVGIEMGVSCDFRLAADTATFCLPEVANIAVLPGSGGISRLTRIVGPHWASWLVMAGERIDAAQARDIGLVHAVYWPTSSPRGPASSPTASPGCRVRRWAWRRPRSRRRTPSTGGTAREFDRLAQSLLFQSDDFRDRVNVFPEQGSPMRVAEPRSRPRISRGRCARATRSCSWARGVLGVDRRRRSYRGGRLGVGPCHRPRPACWLASIEKVSLVLVAADGAGETVWDLVDALRPLTMAPLVVATQTSSSTVVSLVTAGVDAVVDPRSGPDEVFARVRGTAPTRRSRLGTWRPVPPPRVTGSWSTSVRASARSTASPSHCRPPSTRCSPSS